MATSAAATSDDRCSVSARSRPSLLGVAAGDVRPDDGVVATTDVPLADVCALVQQLDDTVRQAGRAARDGSVLRRGLDCLHAQPHWLAELARHVEMCPH